MSQQQGPEPSITKSQTFSLAILISFFYLFFGQVDTAANSTRSEYVNTASGGSSAFITPQELSTTTLYAFPIIEVAYVSVLPESTHLVGPGTHTRAETHVTEEALRQHLLSRNSPLGDYESTVRLIAASPYWSTIIAICTIEQYGCSRLPGGTNWNLYGIGGASGLRVYETAEEGIAAIDALLTRYEAKGYDTIEELNGYYVQPASDNWFNVVSRTKARLEAL